MVRYLTLAGLLLTVIAPIPAASQSRNEFPFSIMNPESGSRQDAAARARASKQFSKVKCGKTKSGAAAEAPIEERMEVPVPRKRARTISRTPSLTIPRTQPMDLTIRSNQPPAPSPALQPSTTFAPGSPPTPNLPSTAPGGKESFSDKAARCAHQTGVYNIPGNQTGTYTSSCINN